MMYGNMYGIFLQKVAVKQRSKISSTKHGNKGQNPNGYEENRWKKKDKAIEGSLRNKLVSTAIIFQVHELFRRGKNPFGNSTAASCAHPLHQTLKRSCTRHWLPLKGDVTGPLKEREEEEMICHSFHRGFTQHSIRGYALSRNALGITELPCWCNEEKIFNVLAELFLNY